MKKIEIIIADKIATPVGTPYIVCGNDNYVINFTFDSEWDGATQKTARFKYLKNGETKYEDVPFNGSICPVPILSDITEVNIGVYVGDLETTTPAKVECRKCILCGDGTHEPPGEDVYNQLIEAINTGLVKGDKGEKGEQGVSGIYVGSGEMPESYNIQIDPNGEPTAGYDLIKETVLNYMYPVGSYYWSSNDTNPSELFGGTWEQVKDKFILAAGNTYNVGTQGGRSSVQLVANIGAVDDDLTTLGDWVSSASAYQQNNIANYSFRYDTMFSASKATYSTVVTDINSANTSTNIMPPYEVAYCWKRTA